MNDASDITIEVQIQKPDESFYDLSVDFDNVKVFLYTEGAGLIQKASRLAEDGFITMAGSGETLTIEVPRAAFAKAKMNDCLYGEVKGILNDGSGEGGVKITAARADIDTIENLMKETKNG